MAAPRVADARPELDTNIVGTYMRDAIERGGYRAALEYYGGDECKESDTPWHRLRAKGWLLGRLGLYGQMDGWLEEAAAWSDFDHLLAAASSGPVAAYTTPALWMETPKPVPRSADYMMTLEPAAAVCRDAGAVPGGVWAAMMALDEAGPICSHAGLGAAAYLVAAGAARRAPGSARGDLPYDPCRGARLHGAPEGCHRWIIADIDFDPWPQHEPHFYYDLTDEGRGALADAKAAGAPRQKAAEAAASGLGGMDLPDLLENACGRSAPARGLDKMRGELGRLVDAWRGQGGGKRAPPVGAEDQALVDLGLTATWSDGRGAASSSDHLLHIVSVIDATCTIAGEAEPANRAEDAVLQTLIGAIQRLCRRHGRAVAASASPAGAPRAAARVDSAARGKGMRRSRRPLYSDAAPALVSDLYYCLAEYCKGRRLATDPCSLPLSERFADDERASVIEALKEDSPYGGAG